MLTSTFETSSTLLPETHEYLSKWSLLLHEYRDHQSSLQWQVLADSIVALEKGTVIKHELIESLEAPRGRAMDADDDETYEITKQSSDEMATGESDTTSPQMVVYFIDLIQKYVEGLIE